MAEYTRFLIQIDPDPDTVLAYHVSAQSHDDAIEVAWWLFKYQVAEQKQIDKDVEDFDRRWKEEEEGLDWDE